MMRFSLLTLLAGCLFACGGLGNRLSAEETRPSEQVVRGDLVAFPGPWSFMLPKVGIILVSDEELETLAADPDKAIDMSTSHDKNVASLRQICESGRQQGAHTLMVAFDHFFQQYRSGQNHERRLMPDTDAYIEKIAKISKFAQEYGLGLELSLLTPLEIGRGYRQATGESGIWMQYRKGRRDPDTGAFSVSLWRHTQWTNNKGPFNLEDAGIRVFAFRERSLSGTPYRVVPEDSITDVTATARVEVLEGIHADGFPATQIRVYGTGPAGPKELNRVLVVQQYRTPEMDYFSDKALPYLKQLVDRYADAGVQLNGLYSDEPHLMGDWFYDRHHDHGQFAMRYLSPGLAAQFAARFGAQYQDLAKYLIYFAYGQEDAASDLSATQGIMHVFGDSPEEIHRTALFRAHYYRFLQDGLTELLVQAKHHAERRMGHRLEARGHATWAESPTCDFWAAVAGVNIWTQKYEYTSDFLWSNTIQQAAVGCADYFRWGDFLTGNGNDHAEGGFLDRNYVGLALACSTGILNEVPYSYGAHWGMPGEIAQRRAAVATAFGLDGSHFAEVQGMVHRDVDVLMLTPVDLVAVEERFGSWTNQYAYANSVTAAKLLERGKVVAGGLEMAGRKFTTLVATFEPFPSQRLLELMKQFVAQGGRLLWSGPPPVLTDEGGNALEPWSALFGIAYQSDCTIGKPVPGRKVVFEGVLQSVSPQIVLTHLLVDHAYPVTVQGDTQPVARIQKQVVGTHRTLPGGGSATFLGFRPLDDQAASLGYETRTWFEVLHALGAYPPSGKCAGVNDNTEYLSRTGEYLACRFPNGAVTVARHLRDLVEDWPGGFARDAEADAKYMKAHPLPPNTIHLEACHVQGHTVDYDGTDAMAFRVDDQGALVAFAGYGCRQICVDGKTTVFAEQPLPLVSFAPVAEARRLPGGAVGQIVIRGTGTIRLPEGVVPPEAKLVVEGPLLGSRGGELAYQRDGQSVTLTIGSGEQGRRIWVVPTK